MNKHYPDELIAVLTFASKNVNGIEAFYLNNPIKYLVRWANTDKPDIKDLYKARDYLNRLIELQEQKLQEQKDLHEAYLRLSKKDDVEQTKTNPTLKPRTLDQLVEPNKPIGYHIHQGI